MKWNKSKFIKYSILIAIIVVLLPFAAFNIFLALYVLFGGDYGINLPSGYSLDQIYGGVVLLSDSSQNIVISPNVDGYKVYEQQNILVGHVSSEGLHSPDSEYSVPGYFIVDFKKYIVRNEVIEIDLSNSLTTRRVAKEGLMVGLDEKSWLDSLKVYGIIEKPKLHLPSITDPGSDYNFMRRLWLLTRAVVLGEGV